MQYKQRHNMTISIMHILETHQYNNKILSQSTTEKNKNATAYRPLDHYCKNINHLNSKHNQHYSQRRTTLHDKPTDTNLSRKIKHPKCPFKIDNKAEHNLPQFKHNQQIFNRFNYVPLERSNYTRNDELFQLIQIQRIA